LEGQIATGDGFMIPWWPDSLVHGRSFGLEEFGGLSCWADVAASAQSACGGLIAMGLTHSGGLPASPPAASSLRASVPGGDERSFSNALYIDGDAWS
jgi:hypothetical protein